MDLKCEKLVFPCFTLEIDMTLVYQFLVRTLLPFYLLFFCIFAGFRVGPFCLFSFFVFLPLFWSDFFAFFVFCCFVFLPFFWSDLFASFLFFVFCCFVFLPVFWSDLSAFLLFCIFLFCIFASFLVGPFCLLHYLVLRALLL